MRVHVVIMYVHIFCIIIMKSQFLLALFGHFLCYVLNYK